jgi:hypothetical protein
MVEKHLYRRQYETAGGDWSTLYYVIFTDWKKKRRTFPVGSDLKTARDECKVLEARNIRKEDCDIKVESKPPERLTVAKYLPVFLETKKGTASYEFWKSCANHLERLLGPIPLDEITRSKMAGYKQRRLTEPIIRRRKPVKDSLVRPSTVNRELTTLINMLNLAAENEVLEKIPATRKLKDSEGHLARERVLAVDEF